MNPQKEMKILIFPIHLPRLKLCRRHSSCCRKTVKLISTILISMPQPILLQMPLILKKVRKQLNWPRMLASMLLKSRKKMWMNRKRLIKLLRNSRQLVGQMRRKTFLLPVRQTTLCNMKRHSRTTLILPGLSLRLSPMFLMVIANLECHQLI